jgi:hypothetical protein
MTMPAQPLCRDRPAAIVGFSITRLVDELVLLDPRHHGAQFFADDFDRMLGHQPAA